MSERKKLLEIVEKLNEKHINDFPNIEEPVLVTVKTNEGDITFKVSKNGIKEETDNNIKNQIILSFKDLEKIEKNKKLVLKYAMSGKIKLKGNIKKLISAIQNIF